MNRDYRIVAQKNDFPIDRVSGDDLSGFPVEQARLRSIWYMLAIAIAAVTGYGWALQARTVCSRPERITKSKYLNHLLARCCFSSAAVPDRSSNNRHLQHLWHTSCRS